MFDSLKSVKRLEQAGVPRQQAETHVQIMTELIISNLVTQEQFKEGMTALRMEISDLRTELKADISALRTDLKEDISGLKTEMGDLRHQMDRLSSQLTIRLGVMMFAGMGLMTGLIKVMLR
jgi:hypothetical protein